MTMPTVARIGLYRTDGRNGLSYDLPAIVTCTRESHPGDYPSTPDAPAHRNPLPAPDEGCVHLTVFTPGGFGSTIQGADPADEDFVGAPGFTPGSGTYVEWNVPVLPDGAVPTARTWRWPTQATA